MYLVLLAYTSSPPSLVATTRASVTPIFLLRVTLKYSNHLLQPFHVHTRMSLQIAERQNSVYVFFWLLDALQG